MRTRKMPHISILPAIDQSEYQDHSAANYLNHYLQHHQLASSEILDPRPLMQYQASTKPNKEVKSLVRKMRSFPG